MQAAGKLFAQQGYNGTSTREIAQLADVSENTLFRHFDHKEDIFWAAIRMQLTGLKPKRDLLSGIERGDSPEMVLPKIIEILGDTVDHRSELLRLLAIAIIELPTKADGLLSQYFTPVFSTIRQYLEMNIKNRTIRDLDSTMLASAMIMTALTHPGIYTLIEGNKSGYSNSLEAHRAYTRFWLDLIVPSLPAYPLPRLKEEYSG